MSGACHRGARGHCFPQCLALENGTCPFLLAFEERVEFKPKGKLNWLLPLSVAFALRGWEYLVHALPGESQGLEKCPPTSGSQCQYCPPCKGHLPPGPESFIVSLDTVGLSKGVEQIQEYLWVSPLRGCLPHPHPAPSHGLTHTWAHTQQTGAALPGSSPGRTVQIRTLSWRGRG